MVTFRLRSSQYSWMDQCSCSRLAFQAQSSLILVSSVNARRLPGMESSLLCLPILVGLLLRSICKINDRNCQSGRSANGCQTMDRQITHFYGHLQMNQPNDDDIRTQVTDALTKYNLKQVDVAREAGIHHSTLSLWLQGKVKGHHIRIEDTLSEWLKNLHSGKPRYASLNKGLDKKFSLTPSSMNMQGKRNLEKDEEILIPIHFDLQIEGKRYKQQFCWNINNPYSTPEDFARLIVSENSALSNFESQIRDNIRKSIASCRSLKVQNSPCLKVLELDVKIDNICLKDRFEWDINDSLNNPEDFAYLLVKELNLNSEFMVKIAHQIREQIEYYRKNQSANSLKTEQAIPTPILDIKKSTRNLISLSRNDSRIDNTVNSTNFIRRNDQEWEPKIQVLDAGEVRKFQKYEERQSRCTRRAR